MKQTAILSAMAGPLNRVAADHSSGSARRGRLTGLASLGKWLACLVAGLLLVSCAATPDPDAIAAEQERARRRAELLTQARDTRLDINSRREAVLTLLASGQPEARQQLVQELRTSTDPTAQQAIAQALAGLADDPPGDFRDPLLSLLKQVDPEVTPALQADVAAALGRYKDDRLVNTLLDAAQNRRETLAYRRGATLTLGYHRSQPVARVLVRLIEPQNPPALRQAAFDALALLSGITTYGADTDRWNAWWDEHRRLSRDQFLARLVENFARRNENVNVRGVEAQTRLIEVQRQLYRAAAAEDRPKVLAGMLADPLDATRQLAMDLMLQRLIDNEPTTPELREALQARLNDMLPVMRQRAALLLREMRDEAAADLIADRLAGGQETDPAVVRAYLLLITRLPRATAVASTLELLRLPELRAEAAGAVAAAADAGLLSAEQARTAASRVRRQLRADQLPEPTVVALLGRIGDSDDWNRIAGWVDANDPAVKQAAAQAWARSDRPLRLLAERAADPVIRDIVIEAAAQRGTEPTTLFTLIAHKPQQEQVVAAWRRAILAMARRVPARSVLDADLQLAERGEPAQFREATLSAALERFPLIAGNGEVNPGGVATTVPSANNDLVDLLLARGEVRLNLEPAQALNDYQRIAATRHPLSQVQQDRYDRGLMRARLANGEIAGAFELARKILGNSHAPRVDTKDSDALAQAFIDSAQRSAVAGRPEQARSVLAQIRVLFGPTISDTMVRRINDMELSLPSAPTEPATTETPPPATPPAGPQSHAPGDARRTPSPDLAVDWDTLEQTHVE